MNSNESDPTVSVIIPTIGRESLKRAVCSVRDQTLRGVQIVIVVDSYAVPSWLIEFARSSELVRCTGGMMGGASARNLGVECASGKYVAFLDDDDWWETDKLEFQIRLLQESSAVWCWGYAVFHRGSNSELVPRRDPICGEDVASYAVSRERVRFGSTFVQSSTLVLDTAVARRFPWDSALERHQDWDLVARLGSAALPMCISRRPSTHVVQQTSRAGSVSRAKDWTKSIPFLRKHSEILSTSARADFYWAILVRKSLSSGDLSVFRKRPKGWTQGHLPAVFVGLAGLVEYLACLARIVREKVCID